MSAKSEESHGKPVRIVEFRAYSSTLGLQNTRDGCQTLNHNVRCDAVKSISGKCLCVFIKPVTSIVFEQLRVAVML
jgi:hypothetical protein